MAPSDDPQKTATEPDPGDRSDADEQQGQDAADAGQGGGPAADPVSLNDLTDDPEAPPLPRFRSHKVVTGFKIMTAERHVDGAATFVGQVPGEAQYYLVTVSPEYVAKHTPDLESAVGGYFVRYEDGYESWSPAAAFENGYTPLREPPAETLGVPPERSNVQKFIVRPDRHVERGKLSLVSYDAHANPVTVTELQRRTNHEIELAEGEACMIVHGDAARIADLLRFDNNG